MTQLIAPFPLAASIACGLSLALAVMPGLKLWDSVAAKRVEHLISLGRAVRLDETRIQMGLRLWGLTMGLLPLATWWFFHSAVLVPLVAYLTYRAPVFLLGWMVNARRRLFRDQLAPACFALAGAARAGLSFSEGLAQIGSEIPDPLGSELTGMARDFDNGRPLTQIVNEAGQRIDIEAFRTFCAAILTCLEHGGPVTETLEGIALTVQENQRLETKMETYSASGRLSLIVLAAFPLFFFLLSYMISPEMAVVYPSTVVGQVVMSIVIGMVYISLRIGRRLLRLERLI